jgi:AcrR family transcriptional regulator
MRRTKAPRTTVSNQAVYAELFPRELSKGEKQRLRMIEAAIECINDFGIDQTNYEAIGKRLGVGRAHVAYYFKSKNDIIEAVLKYFAATAQSVTVELVRRRENADWKEQILAVVDGAFDWAKQHPSQVPILMLLYYLSTQNEKFREYNHAIREAGANRLEALITSAMESRKISRRSADQIRKLAYNIQALINGNLVSCFATNLNPNVEYWRHATHDAALELIS